MLIEPKKVHTRGGATVVKGKAVSFGGFLNPYVIGGTDPGSVALTRRKVSDSGVRLRDKFEYKIIKIRQALTTLINFPIVRIRGQYEALSRLIGKDCEWPRSDDLLG